MMKTIIALLLASSVSAFKPSKAFFGFGGLLARSEVLALYPHSCVQKEDICALLKVCVAAEAWSWTHNAVEGGVQEPLAAYCAHGSDAYNAGGYQYQWDMAVGRNSDLEGRAEDDIVTLVWDNSKQVGVAQCKWSVCSDQSAMSEYFHKNCDLSKYTEWEDESTWCTHLPSHNLCEDSWRETAGTCDHDWCATHDDELGLGWSGQCALYPERCSGCEECICDADRKHRYMLNGVCTACPIGNFCDGFSTWSAASCPAECSTCVSGQSWWRGGVPVVDGVCQDFCSFGTNRYCGASYLYKFLGMDCTPCGNSCPAECSTCLSGGSWDGGVPVVDGVCQDFCSVNGYCGAAEVYKSGGTDCTPCGNGCPYACKTCLSGGSWDGGVPVVDGVCQDFCSVNGYCGAADVYKSGGTDCATCAASSSGNSRSSNASLSIIIPVVIAAVLLVAAVLYLVRKRRVAAATPDETPQLDTEVQVEA